MSFTAKMVRHTLEGLDANNRTPESLRERLRNKGYDVWFTHAGGGGCPHGTERPDNCHCVKDFLLIVNGIIEVGISVSVSKEDDCTIAHESAIVIDVTAEGG